MRTRAALLIGATLLLAGCGSGADTRADACKQALEERLDTSGLLGFTVASNTESTVTGHLDAETGLGDATRVEVTCTLDGDRVTVQTNPAL